MLELAKVCRMNSCHSFSDTPDTLLQSEGVSINDSRKASNYAVFGISTHLTHLTHLKKCNSENESQPRPGKFFESSAFPIPGTAPGRGHRAIYPGPLTPKTTPAAAGIAPAGDAVPGPCFVPSLPGTPPDR